MIPSWHAAAVVARQSIGSDINNVKSTFSSWDSCMSKTYCKWPVIAAIIVGSLIVLSILFCVVRCCCCGMQCCCGICSCCNACCPGGKRNNKDYHPAPQQPMYPPPGYGPPAYGPPPSGPIPWQASPQPPPQNAMMYGGAGGLPQQTAMPTVARFDSSSKREKGGASAAEDQLPAMPSWGAAQEHHVEDTSYQPAADRSTVQAQETIPLQDQRRPSPGPATAYTDNIPLQDRHSPPARSQAASPSQTTTYGQGSEYAPSTINQHHAYNAPTTAYGAGVAAAGIAGAAGASGRYPPEKPSLDTNVTNPNAFARLPHSASPISPATPTASSVYSTNPPPSYHTNAYAAPSVRTLTPGQGFRSPPPQQPPFQAPPPARVQSPYAAYNPFPTGATTSPPAVSAPPPTAAYQAYNPYGSTRSPQETTPTAELGGQQRHELGGAQWGEAPQRRPAPGWREI